MVRPCNGCGHFKVLLKDDAVKRQAQVPFGSYDCNHPACELGADIESLAELNGKCPHNTKNAPQHVVIIPHRDVPNKVSDVELSILESCKRQEKLLEKIIVLMGGKVDE